MSKRNSNSYIMTADANSVVDMQQIEIVRKTVRASNKLAMQNYKWACDRANHYGDPIPKKPSLYRVRLMGRGPRKEAYQDHLKNGGYKMYAGFNCYLPHKYAEKFDVYVHEMRK